MQLIAENGKYVCAEQGGGLSAGGPIPPLIANRDEAGPWETFTLERHDDGTVSLRCASGQYVCAENGGGAGVSTNRTAPGPWERFRLVGNMFQCSDNRHFLKVRTDLAAPVVDATGTLQGLTFRLVGTSPEVTPKQRRGLVRLTGRAFVDDDGLYLAVGASLFWALWGVGNDDDKLAAHLKYLAEHGVDYIRAFGVIGPPWNDRLIDPRDRGWDPRLATLLDRAYDAGLRVELTIWQDTVFTPARQDREQLIDRIASVVGSRPHTIQHVEIANEGYGAGRFPDNWRDEAQQLATRLRSRVPHLVAVTAPPAVTRAEIDAWYGRSAANLLTVHLPRERVGGGEVGSWRPIRQVWDPWIESSLPWTNNEGIGPQSSVAEEDDPTRLTMYAALTWLCGGAGFVLHTGAGVSGAGERGRVRNIWEVAHIEETLGGINAVRQLLPPDLPNWTRHNTNNRFPGYPFDLGPITPLVEREQLVRAFAATADDRVIVMPIGVGTAVPFTPRAPLHVDVHDPLTGRIAETHDGAFTLSPRPAAVMIGRRQ